MHMYIYTLGLIISTLDLALVLRKALVNSLSEESWPKSSSTSDELSHRENLCAWLGHWLSSLLWWWRSGRKRHLSLLWWLLSWIKCISCCFLVFPAMVMNCNWLRLKKHWTCWEMLTSAKRRNCHIQRAQFGYSPGPQPGLKHSRDGAPTTSVGNMCHHPHSKEFLLISEINFLSFSSQTVLSRSDEEWHREPLHILCALHPCSPVSLKLSGWGLAGLCAAPLLFAEGWPPPTSYHSLVNDKGRLLRLH